MYATKQFEFTGEDLDIDFPIGPRSEYSVQLRVVAEGGDDIDKALSKYRPAFCPFESVTCVPVPRAPVPLGTVVTPAHWEVPVGPIPEGIYKPAFLGSTGYLPPDVYQASVTQAERDVLRDGALIGANAAPIEVRFKLGLGTIRGHVVDAENRPVHDVRVTLTEDSPVRANSIYDAVDSMRTDQEGKFEFDRIRPGDYILYTGTEPNEGTIKIHIAEHVQETPTIRLNR
jgi:hypothetical protein